MRIVAVVAAALYLAMSPAPTGAWNDRGHMLVAFVAFRHLHPDVKKEVGRLLKLNPQYKTWIAGLPPGASDERRAQIAFQHASIWPDFIKGAPGYIVDGPNGGNTPPAGASAAQNIGYADKNQHRYWHFVNQPFSDDGTATRNPPAVNARSQMMVMRTALGSPATSDTVKSYDIVWLAHLAGDMHQPLHAVARFTKADRDGDKGGNDVALRCAGWLQCASNLHSQWDGLMGINSSHGSIEAGAAALDAGSPPADAGVLDVDVWIQEDLAIARSSVYKDAAGLALGDPVGRVSLDYVNRAREVARQRVRLGGHRQAALINAAFGH
jgi:hypothetical protein